MIHVDVLELEVDVNHKGGNSLFREPRSKAVGEYSAPMPIGTFWWPHEPPQLSQGICIGSPRAPVPSRVMLPLKPSSCPNISLTITRARETHMPLSEYSHTHERTFPMDSSDIWLHSQCAHESFKCLPSAVNSSPRLNYVIAPKRGHPERRKKQRLIDIDEVDMCLPKSSPASP